MSKKNNKNAKNATISLKTEQNSQTSTLEIREETAEQAVIEMTSDTEAETKFELPDINACSVKIGTVQIVPIKTVEKKEEKNMQKENITDKICGFVESMRGKARANKEELKKMFDLYNEYYGTKEQDIHCDLCAIRIFSKLEKIAKNNEKGK